MTSELEDDADSVVSSIASEHPLAIAGGVFFSATEIRMTCELGSVSMLESPCSDASESAP